MARARLSPEEREIRRKERVAFSFSDAAYTHFDPKEVGYGSEAEWIAASESISEGKTILRDTVKKSIHDKDLKILMLDRLPTDISGLKRAFRNALMLVHPDHGGSNEDTIAAMDAFKRLSKLY